MKKISGSTFYFKKLFPSFWFGFIAFFLVTSGMSGATSPMFFVMPIVLAIFGYVLFSNMIWDLVDEAYDDGDALVFRKGNIEQRVDLDDIINIDYLHMSSPERITVHLRTGGPLGKEIVFCPPMKFNPFNKNPIVRDLIERVDNARRY